MLPINVNLPLKAVTDRMQSCRAVQWAIDTFGTVLVDELGETFDPLLVEGQVMPFEIQLELFKKKLTQDLDQVVTTDRDYRDQKAREAISRERRDDRVTAVNTGVIDLRQAFTGIYSDGKLAEFGFARRTPSRPGELEEQTTYLVQRLSDPDLDLTGSRYDKLQLDAHNMAQGLIKSVETLHQATDELAQQVRKTEALKLAKDNALARYNKSFLWIARTVESLCHLAGLDEVAQRVRPSQRRPGVTAKRFDPDSQSEGEAGDNGSEGEASSEATPEAGETRTPESQ